MQILADSVRESLRNLYIHLLAILSRSRLLSDVVGSMSSYIFHGEHLMLLDEVLYLGLDGILVADLKKISIPTA
jgi:hypothetical protein